jgi:glucosamine--fructose-6-phosphate aminotransferase (isomerizing)
MCGIIGIIAGEPVADMLQDALSRLEYRGYDSAGIACLEAGVIQRQRAEGKLINLRKLAAKKPLMGHIGIGHTRWATHGAPNKNNAHPHATDKVVVVHNGIIENYQALRTDLMAAGYVFHSETDTEIIPNLIHSYLDAGLSPRAAVAKATHILRGAFALAIMFAGEENVLFAAKKGSPLAIGYGKDAMYVGSDAVALAPLTNKVAYLQEGDFAEIHRDKVQIYDADSQPVQRAIKTNNITGGAVGKGDYRHFMLKEIFEQPTVIGQSLNNYYNPAKMRVTLPELNCDLSQISRIHIIACGTSFYAGMVAKYWLESMARIGVEIDVASEFRYRDPVFEKNGLCIVISQSGETADTLAALRHAKAHNQQTIAVVNVAESSMAHEADDVLLTHAGPEIGVASTKSFTTQLTVLACFTLAMAEAKNMLDDDELAQKSHAIAELPARIADILQQAGMIEKLAASLHQAKDMLFMGRGSNVAIAFEAALKMKELSYIHAEAYAAGEMKHGPIALIDENLPIIALAPSDKWFEKTLSNIQEAAARGGKIIVFSDEKGCGYLSDIDCTCITLPQINNFTAPILYAIPVQLLAYHVAVLKGTDVDQPRNLAKSVTVE